MFHLWTPAVVVETCLCSLLLLVIQFDMMFAMTVLVIWQIKPNPRKNNKKK